MSNQPVNKGIKNNWSLLSFARMKGKMQVGQFVNKESGEEFTSCIFTNPNDSADKCFVAFSSKLGVLSPSEIAARKNNLQVVELESGSYILCAEGANAWEDVDLGF